MKVTLEIDRDQLGILMGALEIQLEGSGRIRSAAIIDDAVERAARDYREGNEEEGFAYNVIKIAPVYRQLLKYGEQANVMETGGIYYSEGVFEMVTCLKEARRGSKAAPLPPRRSFPSMG